MRIKYQPRDYEARLNGGVILWDGIPHRIMTNDGQLDIYDLVKNLRVASNVEADDPRLDISSPPLGYLNTDRGAYYLMRSPLRRYQQAMSARNCVEGILGPNGVEFGPEGRSEWLFTKEYRNTFTKGYPTFYEAVDLLDKPNGPVSVAINRECAITKDELNIIKLWWGFGDTPVGFVDGNTRSKIVTVPNNECAWIISMHLSEFSWDMEVI